MSSTVTIEADAAILKECKTRSPEKGVVPVPGIYDEQASANRQQEEERIRRRAFELYEQRGHEEGHDLDDWLRAEAELSREVARAA
jgi:hypothetical protein